MNVLGRTIRTTYCGFRRGPTRTTPSTRSTIQLHGAPLYSYYSSSSSQDGMRMFFQWLEEKFGGSLPMQEGYDDNHQTVVVTRSDGILRYDDLCSLFHHEITVLKVSNYYPRTTAIQLGKELAKQAINDNNTTTSSNNHDDGGSSLKNWKVSTAKGLESSDVFTLGAHLPYNIAFNNPDSIVEEYYKKVPIEFKQRRQRRKQQHDVMTIQQQLLHSYGHLINYD